MTSRRNFLLCGLALPAFFFPSKERLLSDLPYGTWFRCHKGGMALRVSRRSRHKATSDGVYATSSKTQVWVTKNGITREEGGVYIFRSPQMVQVIQCPDE